MGLSLFAMFYGLDFIATVPPSVRLTAQAFGREQAPLVFGWIFAGHQLGAGVMAFATGVSRDVLASYLPGFFAAGVLCIAATLALWLLKGAQPGGPDGAVGLSDHVMPATLRRLAKQLLPVRGELHRGEKVVDAILRQCLAECGEYARAPRRAGRPAPAIARRSPGCAHARSGARPP